MHWLIRKDDLGLELSFEDGYSSTYFGESIDFSEMEVQDGEGDGQFSFWPKTEQDEMNTIDRGEIHNFLPSFTRMLKRLR